MMFKNLVHAMILDLTSDQGLDPDGRMPVGDVSVAELPFGQEGENVIGQHDAPLLQHDLHREMS